MHCTLAEHQSRSAARRSGAVLLAALLGVWLVLLSSGPAAAHAELESSSPKDGATLATAPKEISFTFGEDLLDSGNAITLTPAGAKRLTLAAPTIDGDTISVDWPNVAPAGEFTAAFRVVSEDGHPVEGAITFTVKQPTAEEAPRVSASPAAAPLNPPPSDLPSAAASAPSTTGSTGAEPESQPEAGVLAWVLGIGVVALIGALAATWVTRRTRRP